MMSNTKIRVYPTEFPESWASDWGEDEYGLWMGFTYKGIKQLFRWIEPGSFLMGSPEDEPERYSDEIQHLVTLSKGFWLADTTVTQALWQAFMGDNPSRFKSGDRPVENVSWNDAQAFITKINSLKPELKLCLPTEAQWEYACRAGTVTPFSFGVQLSSEQANFDGTEPYINRKLSRYRQETIGVKSLPPNAWGLYEMHGNIWEWCHDWIGEYPTEPVIDPLGPDIGSRRILRGGAWIHRAGDCRSADRYASNPGSGHVHYGFRLAITQKASSVTKKSENEGR